MPLSIEKVEHSDLSTITDLAFSALKESSPVDRLIYPLGFTPSVSSSALALQKSSFFEPNTHHFKVVDSSLATEKEAKSTVPDNSIIAYARLHLWQKDREAADLDRPFSIKEGDLGAPGDVNLEIARTFAGQRREMSKKIIKGRKCVYLNWLVTDPSHQRRGAGTLLMQRVCEMANREGLDIYLQATPAGYPLYRKLGFEDVASFDLDLGTLASGVASGESYRTVLMKLKFTAPDPRPSWKSMVVWPDDLFSSWMA